MTKLLAILLLLSATLVRAQETEGDSISNKKFSSHWASKHKFRRTVNVSNGVFFRFADNPAFTGYEGNSRFSGHPYSHNLNVGYFAKWPSLNITQGDDTYRAPSGYFATYEVAFGRRSKSNLGLVFSQYNAGYTKGRTAGISYAYTMYFSRKTQLRLGVSINHFTKLLRYNGLSFGDMIDARYGFIFGTNEIRPYNGLGYLDFNLGLYLKIRNLHLGGSMISVTQPDMGWLGLGIKPRTYFMHGQYDIFLSRRVIMNPYLQVKLSYVNRVTPGIAMSIMEKYLAGVSIENMNVVRGLIGYELGRKYRLSLSGGIPIEKELRAFSTVAYVEGGFRYLFTIKKKKKDEEDK